MRIALTLGIVVACAFALVGLFVVAAYVLVIVSFSSYGSNK